MLVSGCASSPTRTPFTSVDKRDEVSRTRIGYEIFDFVTRFSREVEYSADEIARNAADPEVRHQAILWKMNAVASATLAIEHVDLVAMLYDLWALCLQQSDYFRDGAGKNLFGDQQPLAMQTSQRLQQQVETLAEDLLQAESVAVARMKLEAWVAEHPIENYTFTRPSPISSIANLFPEGTGGVLGSLGNMETRLDDLRSRLALQADQLPRQARWQAELMVSQAIRQVVEPQLTDLLGQVSQERQAILADVSRQRVESLDRIHEELIFVIEVIRGERLNVMSNATDIVRDISLDVERILDGRLAETLSAINAQRVETLEALRDEPVTVKAGLDPSVLALIDRLYVRGMVSVAVFYMVTLITIVFLYEYVRRRRNS